jgi:hypothetical protein
VAGPSIDRKLDIDMVILKRIWKAMRTNVNMTVSRALIWMLIKEHAADLLVTIELNCSPWLLYTLKFKNLAYPVLIRAATHPTIGKSSSSQMRSWSWPLIALRTRASWQTQRRACLDSLRQEVNLESLHSLESDSLVTFALRVGKNLKSRMSAALLPLD